jgi:hypothetical protein
MSRKSITVDASVYERLADHKDADESWSDFGARVADTLEDDDGGEHKPSTVAVTNVDEVARATADEVENRMTRR